MTREEEIIQAADECYPTWEEHNAGFYQGAKWADQHPRKGLVAIEKVEKVLGNLLFNKEEKIYTAYLDYDAFFEDFHKAMED